VSLRARPEIHPDFSTTGVLLAVDEPGVLISKVAGEGSFAELGAAAGDRLLALDGRPFDDAGAADRYLDTAAGSIWATLCRNERVWGALISHE
jgi:S1-C subfamily serine protease